ncbi:MULTISPECIES: hypothetical protein [Microbulbifer]|uniref:flagellar basal body rod protein FlgB n=1 Tax=Microbulbifer TaxID=48073 RepID=UPI001E3858C3|nr:MULTISPECIES: hypothetical protein [Microbulbifer]UHQ56899.1 hypothetical protein LVE68_07960 [Microbulbifer sp. YPW16]
MIDELSGSTSALVKVMLDANLQSQRLSANNIANVNSRGYSPMAVDFTRLYQDAEAILLGKGESSVNELNAVKGAVGSREYTLTQNSEVSLDMEMVRLNQAVVQYQTLLKALGKYGGLVKMAINGEQAK